MARKSIEEIRAELDALNEQMQKRQHISDNFIIANTIKNQSPAHIEKVSKKNRGQKRSESQKMHMSDVQKKSKSGVIPEHLFDPEIRKKAGISQRGMKKPKTSLALTGKPSLLKGIKRPQLSASLIGKPKSEEHKANMRKPKNKLACIHCGLLCAPNTLSRFHGDNCKQK